MADFFRDPPLLVWLLAAGLLGPVLYAWCRVGEMLRGGRKQYVTHEQLNAVKAERDAQIQASVGEIAKKIDILDTDFRDQMIVIHRAIGKMEGQEAAQRQTRRRRSKKKP